MSVVFELLWHRIWWCFKAEASCRNASSVANRCSLTIDGVARSSPSVEQSHSKSLTCPCSTRRPFRPMSSMSCRRMQMDNSLCRSHSRPNRKSGWMRNTLGCQSRRMKCRRRMPCLCRTSWLWSDLLMYLRLKTVLKVGLMDIDLLRWET